MSPFKKKVIDAVKMVPYGHVASYGQIALMVGVPRGARMVGQILNSMEENIFESRESFPWWRIVNNAGRVSIKGTKYHSAQMQKTKLESEGIFVKDDLTFDIEKYRYRPDPEEISKLRLDDESVQQIIEKYLL